LRQIVPERIEFLQANGEIDNNRQQKSTQTIRKEQEMSHRWPQLDEKRPRNDDKDHINRQK